MKRSLCMLVGMAGMVLFAIDPVVTDVVAKQRYPWNGLVDITCTVSEIVGRKYFAVAAVIPDSSIVREVSHFWVVQGGTNSIDRKVLTNGTYRLLWDARADLGQIRYSNMVVRVTAVEHDKVQLWEDGPYWAETNIGAEEPWDYGYYFWWGDIVGYKRENNKWVASDGSSLNFSFEGGNVPTHNKGIATLQSEGWITAGNILVPEHDAAHVQWGGKWRMPTEQELDDLESKCDWTCTTTKGVNGYIVRGKGDYASASIFLPAVGIGDGTSLHIAGSYGLYLSSVPDSDGSYGAWALGFELRSYHQTRNDYDSGRYCGQAVRPVQGFTE